MLACFLPLQVYLTLLKLLVTPCDVKGPSGSPTKQQTKPTDVKTVLSLLQNYLQCIDLSQVRLEFIHLRKSIKVYLLKTFSFTIERY